MVVRTQETLAMEHKNIEATQTSIARGISMPLDQAPVLIALINHTRDLQVAKEQGWYRIPVARAPAQLAAEYLAFYQTRVFGAEKWAVRYYAAILRYRIAARKELLPTETTHPRAQNLYYCLELGPIEQLERPIPAARLRRVTFIRTTFGQMRRATDVRELWHAAEGRENPGEGLWAAGLAGKSIVS